MLDDWENAEVLFDSRTDFPSTLAGGWLTLEDPSPAPRRFLRLRVIFR